MFMKPFRFLPIIMAVGLSLFACEEGDSPLPNDPTDPGRPPVQPARVNFDRSAIVIREDQPAGGEITLLLSSPAPEAGTVTLHVSSASAVYGDDYTTVPAAIGGEITWVVEPATSALSLRVLPIAQELATGARTIQFTIDRASGGVRPGDTRTLTVTIEAEAPTPGNRLARYETYANHWRTSRAYTYTAEGRVHQLTGYRKPLIVPRDLIPTSTKTAAWCG